MRVEKDSLGEVEVPQDALYGAQTGRAVENFQISELKLPREMIRALGLIKAAAARVNFQMGILDEDMSGAIHFAASEVAEGKHDEQFPVDIFQTGSGTSSNMNANEVIAKLASHRLGKQVHPNDHVNLSQSSNDVFPSAIYLGTCLVIDCQLKPAIDQLHSSIEKKAQDLGGIVTTGRTHLMDAMPVTYGQVLGGWASQIRDSRERICASLVHLSRLPLGGTAVGTGINSPQGFGENVVAELVVSSGLPLQTSVNRFATISSPDAAVEMSGQLKGLAIVLTKISNDLRWLNSGPGAGIGEISLPVLQPGSSIMPGKVNPVIPEAVVMACAQVMGNDLTVSLGGQSGNFQLNVMLPVIGHNLLQSTRLLSRSCISLADKAIDGFCVNEEKIRSVLGRNPILVTALNSRIGYEKGAEIAKQAIREGRPVKDVALEQTDLSAAELDALLDPSELTKGGFPGKEMP
ncbi:MAG: class II fumarate hydratase [Verrucomicrobiales bacterium]|nr:class II fumarate hydratase [Verrucomicrobiales bacterium]